MSKEKKNIDPKFQPNPELIGKLQREMWYPTPIWFVDFEDSEQINKKLRKLILDWKKRDEKGIVRSNSLGWHSAVDMHHRNEYNFFTRKIFEYVNQVLKDNGGHPDFEAWCDNMWANTNQKYAHNRNHIHPGGLFSGVYYVQSPKECGRIWFTDPRTEAHMITMTYGERPPFTWREIYYEPIPGRLIIFPSWLTHEVEPNMTDATGDDEHRISISFNFGQRLQMGKKGMKLGKGHDSGGGLFMDNLKDDEKLTEQSKKDN